MSKMLSILAGLLITSSAFAQSVGGGLGGDRPSRLRILSEARPQVINSMSMGCNEVQDFIIKNDKARVNMAYKKVNGFQVIFSRYAISCGNIRMVTPVSIPTKDHNTCYAGFVCGGGFR